MSRLPRTLAAIALSLCALAPHAASVSSADYSDLWWVPTENGWGAHVTLQEDVIFMVLYVYDAAQQPRFFVAPNLQRVDFSAYPGETFMGALYATQGPHFASAFDTARVTAREVGNARMSFTTPGSAILSYVVDGVAVNKTLSRQQWRAPDLAGEYKGGLFATATPATCPLALPSVAYPGSFRVSLDGEAFTLDSTFAPGFAEDGSCRYTGRIQQAGKLASVVGGTYSCQFSNTNTVTGTFEMTAIESGPNGFSGRYSATEGAACRHTGSFGGSRRGYDRLPDTQDPLPAP